MDPSGAPAATSGRVIFTAPIKALSNERYMELRSMGFDAGLETGDFKKNAGAQVLCCTQEIYTSICLRPGTKGHRGRVSFHL
jgi:superfamily II RNA helicase